MASVTLRGLQKSFAGTKVIGDLDLDIADGEFVVFVGPSGCGKTTLLRMIAGLEELDAGTIDIDGQCVNDIAPAKRGVAMVFQTYALYPHMTVFDNMAFGLRQANTPKDDIARRVKNAAQVLQLTDYLTRNPRQLSGGQRQRVAIGRAIVREPKVFLFDEPLSNLDAALRVQTRIEIAQLHKRLQSTMIYITHDQVEAMTLSDKIVVLRSGHIEQVGSPMDLYQKPQNTFVATFIGSPQMNIFHSADIKIGRAEMLLGVRPEHLQTDNRGYHVISGRVELIEQLGEYIIAHMKSDSAAQFTVKLPATSSNIVGKDIDFFATDNHMHWFDKQTGQRINKI